MTIIKVEVNEDDEQLGQHDQYELNAGTLPEDKLNKLCEIVDECKVLEHDELHYGPVRGTHEVLIAVETSNSMHEIHACDVELSGAPQALAAFIMDEGQKVEADTNHAKRHGIQI